METFFFFVFFWFFIPALDADEERFVPPEAALRADAERFRAADEDAEDFPGLEAEEPLLLFLRGLVPTS